MSRRRISVAVAVAFAALAMLLTGCQPGTTSGAGIGCDPNGVALFQPAECRGATPQPAVAEQAPEPEQEGCERTGWGPLSSCASGSEQDDSPESTPRLVPDADVDPDWVATVARHEAGHKAIADEHGWTVVSARVREDGTGAVTVRGLRRQEPYLQVAFYVAGVAAVGTTDGASEDLGKVQRVLNRLPADQRDAVEDAGWDEAERVVAKRAAQINEDAAVLACAGEAVMGLYPEWMVGATCAEVDPELFFPEKGDPAREARHTCGLCDVKAQCLAYALENPELRGVWGGTTERDRDRIRRGEQAPVRPPQVAPTVLEHGARIRALAEQGMDDIQIAQECGLTQSKVWRIRDKAGIAHGRYHRRAAA